MSIVPITLSEQDSIVGIVEWPAELTQSVSVLIGAGGLGSAASGRRGRVRRGHSKWVQAIALQRSSDTTRHTCEIAAAARNG